MSEMARRRIPRRRAGLAAWPGTRAPRGSHARISATTLRRHGPHDHTRRGDGHGDQRRWVVKAAVLRAGGVVVRDDVTEPVPAFGQVLVQVRACGICGSDLHFVEHGATML